MSQGRQVTTCGAARRATGAGASDAARKRAAVEMIAAHEARPEADGAALLALTPRTRRTPTSGRWRSS